MSTPKPKPRTKRKTGTAMVPVPPKLWVRQYKCGCLHEFQRKGDVDRYCRIHLRDPEFDPVAVYDGQEPPEPRQPEGRPTLYTQAIAEAVCARVAIGWRARDFEQERAKQRLMADGMPDEEMERVLSTLPGATTVKRWVAERVEFRTLYAQARKTFLEHGLIEETEEIADDSSRDTYVDDKGNTRTDNEVVARSRLRVDLRWKQVERAAPSESIVKIRGDRDQPLLPGKAGAQQLTDEELVLEIVQRRAERQKQLERK